MGQIKNIKLHIVTDIKWNTLRNSNNHHVIWKEMMVQLPPHQHQLQPPAPWTFLMRCKILKLAMIHDGMARGLREAVKALDKRQALLCILANNCDEQTYVKLIEALCAEHGINLIKVDEN